jgi:hypothetical protein
LEAEEVGDFGAILGFLDEVAGGVDLDHREEADEIGGIFRVVLEGFWGVGTSVQRADDVAFDFEVAGQGREVAVEAEYVPREGAGDVEESDVAAERCAVLVPEAQDGLSPCVSSMSRRAWPAGGKRLDFWRLRWYSARRRRTSWLKAS